IQYGEKIFGKKFRPIENVLSLYEYNQLLNNIDILIFNNEKQQGLHNVYYMLAHGKKIYLNSKGSTYNVLSNWGASVYSTTEISNLTDNQLFAFTKDLRIKNIKIAQKHISVEASFNGWKEMFSFLLN
ncbi:hypothetical protein, partial [Sulfurovum riftiae]|uniref:hypothetical protein n=1 Tax=Sulfurovum riftiae TaxID=1630136 RepID=UPI000AE2CCF4